MCVCERRFPINSCVPVQKLLNNASQKKKEEEKDKRFLLFLVYSRCCQREKVVFVSSSQITLYIYTVALRIDDG